MTIAEALREAAGRLAGVSDSARLDAEVLMAEALGATRSEILLRHQRDEVPPQFEALVDRRLRHEPVAQILGRKEFYGLQLEVTPDVLIPRGDSETLIEAARKALADRPPKRILDLGTGSGALLLAALTVWSEAEGVGVDCDPNSVFVALRNAERVGVNIPPDSAEMDQFLAKVANAGIDMPSGHLGYRAAGRASFRVLDWNKRGWKAHLGTFDLILANPPYIEEGANLAPSVRDFEPRGALFAGPDGLDAYRVLIRQLPSLLSPGAIALLEIGATQAEAVTALAARSGFTAVLHRDLGGRPRALVLSSV